MKLSNVTLLVPTQEELENSYITTKSKKVWERLDGVSNVEAADDLLGEAKINGWLYKEFPEFQGNFYVNPNLKQLEVDNEFRRYLETTFIIRSFREYIPDRAPQQVTIGDSKTKCWQSGFGSTYFFGDSSRGTTNYSGSINCKTESPETIEYIVINDVIKECLKNIDTQNYVIKFDEINRVQTSGRPIQLKRAFQNIIDNSKRYANEIIIYIFLDENGCNVNIDDNGPGIPPEKYEDVFKPFFTLDVSRNKLKGESGLGLTITRDIIRSHGGEIKLDKSSSGGLKLSVLLPI